VGSVVTAVKIDGVVTRKVERYTLSASSGICNHNHRSTIVVKRSDAPFAGFRVARVTARHGAVNKCYAGLIKYLNEAADVVTETRPDYRATSIRDELASELGGRKYLIRIALGNNAM